jgi:competence protein ComEC
MSVLQKITRFRAYQLGNAGSSFSYFDGSDFTLIEARYNEINSKSIESEMLACGISEISTLHITSWDQDHCVPSQLQAIIEKLKPKKIEYPGYDPHTTSGMSSLKIILESENAERTKRVIQITPEYISNLNKSEGYGYRDILYHPKIIDENSSNNNSTVKLFRTGSFNVLSLGDVENSQISSGLRCCSSIKNEVDVMILAHHGADNGFTSSAFLKAVRPKVAIASADYANQFEHPRQVIRDRLYEHDIKLFTTKTGDVVIYSTGAHVGKYKLDNLKAGSSEVSSTFEFRAKKLDYLNVNEDTLRARFVKPNRGMRG